MNRLLIILTITCVLNQAIGQSKNFIDQPYLETLAKVDTLITPDLIYLSVLISERDTKGKLTIEDLEQKMGQKLIEIGIDLEKQLSLTDLSSNFKKYFLRKQDILKLKSYELLVFDAKTAGRVIYEMEGIGLSNVDLERTEYSKIEDLNLYLKSQAIRKAKKQARSLLEPINQSVGNAIFVTDLFERDVSNLLQGRAAGIRIRGASSKRQEYIAIPIEFDKIKVESQVKVKFIIDEN